MATKTTKAAPVKKAAEASKKKVVDAIKIAEKPWISGVGAKKEEPAEKKSTKEAVKESSSKPAEKSESKKSFFGSILHTIESVANSVADFFNDIPQAIKDIAEDVAPVISGIKDALESKAAIVLTEIIPGEWDETLRRQAIGALQEFLNILKATESAASTQSVHEFTRQMTLQKMSAVLMGMKDKNKLPQNRYDLYAQAYYSGKK